MQKVRKHIFLFITILLLSMVVMPLQALAATDSTLGLNFSSTDSGKIDANGTKATLSITATGVLSAAEKSTTVTITNGTGNKAKVSFNYSATVPNASSYCTISDVDDDSGTACVVTLEAGGSFTVSMKAQAGRLSSSTTKLEMTDITVEQVFDSTDLTVKYENSMGSVSSSSGVVTADSTLQDIAADSILTATANTGAQFVGWIDDTGKVLGSSTTYKVAPTAEAMTVNAVFATTTPWFYVDNANYLVQGWTEAIKHTGTIVLANNATLPAGDYTIPSGINLLIPYDAGNSSTFGTSPTSITYPTSGSVPGYNGVKLGTSGFYGSQYPYRTLTVGANTTITCYGAINVNSAVTASTSTISGSPTGPYGHINLSDSSSRLILASANTTDDLTTNDTAGVLYCYGYITGVGKVEVQSGASLYEMIQALGWRGGSMVKSWIDQATSSNPTIKSFIFSDYAVQNVEADVLAHYGATSYVVFCMDTSVSDPKCITSAYMGPGIGLIQMNSGSAAMRQYDEVNNRMKFTLAGSANIGSIDITVKFTGLLESSAAKLYFGTDTISLNTADHIFGICSNMDFVVDSGATVSIPNAIKMLPDTTLSIKGEGTDFLGNKKDAGTLNVSGTLYLYDQADYLGNGFVFYQGTTAEIGAYYGHWDSLPVPFIATTLKSSYRASSGNEFVTEIVPLDQRTDVPSAQLIVNGNLNVINDGAIYTSANGGTSSDKVITGTGTFTHTGKTGTSILDEMQGWYDGSEFWVDPVEIPTTNVVGLLAGVSTSAEDVNDSFGAGTYYGQPNGYWYNYTVTAEGGAVNVTTASAATGNTTGEVAHVASGGTVTFTAEGYEVSVNGTVLEPSDDGTYTLENVSADTTISLTPVLSENITIKGGTLLFKDAVQIKYTFTVLNETAEQLENAGIEIWNEEDYATTYPSSPTQTISGLEKNGTLYQILTDGISAKNMGDLMYVRGYIDIDGSREYTKLVSYSPAVYCEKKITEAANKPDDADKQLLAATCISLMNYGAEAQKYFAAKGEYTYDTLMNSFMTPEQQAWTYDANALVATKALPTYEWTPADGSVIKLKSGTVVMTGAVQLKIIAATNVVGGNISMLYWTESAAGENLLLNNASQMSDVGSNGEVYQGYIRGISAKNMGDTYYLCAAVTDENGTTSYSTPIAYSVHKYAGNQIAKDNDIANLSKTLVIYNAAAKEYLARDES